MYSLPEKISAIIASHAHGPTRPPTVYSVPTTTANTTLLTTRWEAPRGQGAAVIFGTRQTDLAGNPAYRARIDAAGRIIGQTTSPGLYQSDDVEAFDWVAPIFLEEGDVITFEKSPIPGYTPASSIVDGGTFFVQHVKDRRLLNILKRQLGELRVFSVDTVLDATEKRAERQIPIDLTRARLKLGPATSAAWSSTDILSTTIKLADYTIVDSSDDLVAIEPNCWMEWGGMVPAGSILSLYQRRAAVAANTPISAYVQGVANVR